MKRILVIDDSPMVCRLLKAVLKAADYEDVLTAETGAKGLDKAGESKPALVILDLNLPDMSGLEVLKQLKASRPHLPVIMLTGSADLESAITALRSGAYHYFTKPFDNEQLQMTVQRALENKDLIAEIQSLRQKVGRSEALNRILGQSPAAEAVRTQIQKVALSDLTVLIEGETGTGKELVARALHEESPRRGKPFVAIDCGALAENLLESELFGHEKGAFTGADRKKDGQILLAQGGTLFLDEIGNLPLSLQTKMLRVLQERNVRPVGAEKSFPIHVRFIAATNASLEADAESGKFRQDLYYRLAEFTIPLPSLRERRNDVLLLAQKFREEAGLELKRNVVSIDPDALKLLESHSWPGNIRELRNVIRQAVLTTPDLAIHADQVKDILRSGKKKNLFGTATPLELAIPPGASLREIAESAEKQAIRDVLRTTQGNKNQAAKILKTDYKTFYLKVKRYGL